MDVLQIDQTSSVTQKGQVTIPAMFRKKLGIKAGSKIYFEIDADYVKLRPVKHTLESVYASVSPLNKKLTDKQMRKIALEDKVNAFR